MIPQGLLLAELKEALSCNKTCIANKTLEFLPGKIKCMDTKPDARSCSAFLCILNPENVDEFLRSFTLCIKGKRLILTKSSGPSTHIGDFNAEFDWSGIEGVKARDCRKANGNKWCKACDSASVETYLLP